MNRRIRRRLGADWPGHVEYSERRGFHVLGWPFEDEPLGALNHLYSTINLGHRHVAAAPRLTALINEARGVAPWEAVLAVLRDVALPLAVAALGAWRSER